MAKLQKKCQQGQAAGAAKTTTSKQAKPVDKRMFAKLSKRFEKLEDCLKGKKATETRVETVTLPKETKKQSKTHCIKNAFISLFKPAKPPISKTISSGFSAAVIQRQHAALSMPYTGLPIPALHPYNSFVPAPVSVIAGLASINVRSPFTLSRIARNLFRNAMEQQQQSSIDEMDTVTQVDESRVAPVVPMQLMLARDMRPYPAMAVIEHTLSTISGHARTISTASTLVNAPQPRSHAGSPTSKEHHAKCPIFLELEAEREIKYLEGLVRQGMQPEVAAEASSHELGDRIKAIRLGAQQQMAAVDTTLLEQATNLAAMTHHAYVLQMRLNEQTVLANQYIEYSANLQLENHQIREEAEAHLAQVIAQHEVQADFVDARMQNLHASLIASENRNAMLQQQYAEAQASVEPVLPTIELLQNNVATTEAIKDAALEREQMVIADNVALKQELEQKNRQIDSVLPAIYNLEERAASSERSMNAALQRERAVWYENEDLRQRLADMQRQVDSITPTFEILQTNNQTLEDNYNAVKRDNEVLKMGLWQKVRQHEESERCLQMSQKLHRTETERCFALREQIKELKRQSRVDTQVTAAKMSELEFAAKADQEVAKLIADQNSLLREAFRAMVIDKKVTIKDSDDLLQDVDRLLEANQQQEQLTIWLQGQISDLSRPVKAAEVESQLVKTNDLESTVSALKDSVNELQEKLIAEEIETGSKNADIKELKHYIRSLHDQIEKADTDLVLAKQDVTNWSNAMQEVLRSELTSANLIRGSDWIVDKLMVELSNKNDLASQLSNTVAHLQNEVNRVKRIGNMNINMVYEFMAMTRTQMGDTILLAEANYRERNEAYAKVAALEKRFAGELEAEPLVVGPMFVAPFDEVAPPDFQEQRLAAYKFFNADNADCHRIICGDLADKPWWDLTEREINRIRMLDGMIPPKEVTDLAAMIQQQQEEEMEAGMGRVSEDLSGLVVEGEEEVEGSGWVTATSDEQSGFDATAYDDSDMF